MALLWRSEQGSGRVMDAISSLASDSTIESQMNFVSQTTQDTMITVGKATLAANDDVKRVAQSFTADGPYVSKVTAWVGKAATPTDYIVCEIFSDNSNAPSTTKIVRSTTKLTAADLADTPAAEDFEFNEIDFASPLVYGKKYWISFRRTDATTSDTEDTSDTNYFEVNYKGTSSTVANHALSRSDDGTSWTVDASGYDLYHIIYAGDLPTIKDLKVSGGSRDADALKLVGYNEIIDLKRATPIEMTFTAVYQNKESSGWLTGTPLTVTGAYYRTTGGEKSASDRVAKAVAFLLTAGTNHVSILLNNARCTDRGGPNLTADGTVEETFTFKGVASNYYEEDDYA